MGILTGIFSRSAQDIPVVCDVDLQRYVGTWYEIARLRHSFEEGLDHVTATYQLRSDGKMEVTNTGIKDGRARGAKAVAWIPDQECPGRLLISFFWPIRNRYNIIRLDPDYRFAVVTGSRMSHLWILGREPQMDEERYDELVQFAAAAGFDSHRLIRVTQAEKAGADIAFPGPIDRWQGPTA